MPIPLPLGTRREVNESKHESKSNKRSDKHGRTTPKTDFTPRREPREPQQFDCVGSAQDPNKALGVSSMNGIAAPPPARAAAFLAHVAIVPLPPRHPRAADWVLRPFVENPDCLVYRPLGRGYA